VRVTGGAGLTAAEGGARARERRWAARGGGGGRARRAGERRGGWVGFGPTEGGDFPLYFSISISPFYFEQIFSYIFLGAKTIFYVWCY
jgi:hypothetical protein